MKNHHVILGGMGPQASLQLHKLLLEQDREALRGPEDYPFILHASMPIPDFISDGGRTDDAVRLIQDTCSQLPLDGAASVGIACNTAHLLLDRLTAIPRYNFVSMIDSVVSDVSTQHLKKVGLLATPFTIKNKLYHHALKKADIEVVQPSSEQISELDYIIHRVIAGENALALRERLTLIGNTLIERGADSIVLGCTELPLVGVDCSVPTFDSLSSLARHMIGNKV